MKNENEKNIYIKKYMDEILTPLDDFYTSNYKYLQNKNGENQKTLENAYDLYLKKLENFSKIIDCYIEKQENNKKDMITL